MTCIYLASSWRNAYQPDVLAKLCSWDFDVYDYRNPAPGNGGFSWSDISMDWQDWTSLEFRAALEHPIALKGFQLDKEALEKADIVVLLLPSGRSSHIEAAYHAGKGKPVVIFCPPLEWIEPELMYGLLGSLCLSWAELEIAVKGLI